MLRKVPLALLINRPTHTSFHNLCTNPHTCYLPKNIKTLLGLGLNFCIQPEKSSPINLVDLDQFRKDIHRIIMLSNTPEEEERSIPKLYLPDPDWQPAEPENEELANRCNNFISTILKNSANQKNSLQPTTKSTSHPTMANRTPRNCRLECR